MQSDRRQFLAAGAMAGLAGAADLHQPGMAQEQDAEEKFTWFCARVPYNVPNGRHVKRLSSESPLKFFQDIWPKKVDSKDALGILSYGTADIFGDPESDGPAPADARELAKVIKQHCYVRSIRTQDGQLEYQSDDDEFDMSYYFFDSEFARRNPDRVSFLLHRGWLPTEVRPSKDSKPATHILSRMPTQTCDSNQWDYFKVEGTRLNQIGEVFATMKATRFSDSAEMQKYLETQPKDQNWALTFAKFIAENVTFKENKTEFQCSPHICELNHHAFNWGQGGKNKVFNQFIVFDDLWAASYPDLFTSMLRFQKEELLFV